MYIIMDIESIPMTPWGAQSCYPLPLSGPRSAAAVAFCAVMRAQPSSRSRARSWAAYLHRVLAWLAGGFAALALLLSTIGVYGVIAYSVNSRTREIGVRIALGATRGSVYQLILKEAGRLILIGFVTGLSGAIAAGVLMSNLLFGVHS
jgi:predicted lysophospholipase L1 biosynthesis ABC-type transport system permease subunit